MLLRSLTGNGPYLVLNIDDRQRAPLSRHVNVQITKTVGQVERHRNIAFSITQLVGTTHLTLKSHYYSGPLKPAK